MRLQYSEYADRMASETDAELIAAFNREVGNPGWTSSRGAYLAALHDAFIARGFDYSAIGNENGLSFRSRITLDGKTIEPVDPGVEIGPAMLRVKPAKD